MITDLTELPYDSQLIGLPVARLSYRGTADDLVEAFQQTLQTEFHDNFGLVYLVTTPTPEALDALHRLGSSYVDHRLTYLSTVQREAVAPCRVVPYQRRKFSNSLIDLALTSSRYSRFRRDPAMPDGVADRLFHDWIHASVNGQRADVVLVICDDDQEVAMITLRQEQSVAEIGLVAVAEHVQGRGYGKDLLRAALHWCYERHISTVRVVTQGANHRARALYQSAGFVLASEELVAHVWLRTPTARVAAT